MSFQAPLTLAVRIFTESFRLIILCKVRTTNLYPLFCTDPMYPPVPVVNRQVRYKLYFQAETEGEVWLPYVALPVQPRKKTVVETLAPAQPSAVTGKGQARRKYQRRKMLSVQQVCGLRGRLPYSQGVKLPRFVKGADAVEAEIIPFCTGNKNRFPFKKRPPDERACLNFVFTGKKGKHRTTFGPCRQTTDILNNLHTNAKKIFSRNSLESSFNFPAQGFLTLQGRLYGKH
jgi:hypothetical protein